MSGCDYIVNFAAETHVDRSLTSADPFLKSNVIGTYVLLETARELKPEKFVHISTDEVYGPILEGSANESFPLNPSSPYSASKVSADALCNAYRVSFGVPTILIRPTNNYGPFQYHEKLIPFFVKRAVSGKSLPIYASGKQQRDWLHVDDNCRAINLVLNKGEIGEIYNVGSDNHKENIEISRRLLSILGLPENRIEHVGDRPGHDFRYAVDSSKLRALGWKPEIPFDSGFEKTVLWFAKKFGGGS
jgi:dTDP-glucose 4,6-dehydratase